MPLSCKNSQKKACKIIKKSYLFTLHKDEYSKHSFGLSELEWYAEDDADQSVRKIEAKKEGVEPGFEAMVAEDVLFFLAERYQNQKTRRDYIKEHGADILRIYEKHEGELSKYLVKQDYQLTSANSDKVAPAAEDVRRTEAIKGWFEICEPFGALATLFYIIAKTGSTTEKNVEAVLEVLANDVARTFGMAVQEQTLYKRTYDNGKLKLMPKAKWLNNASTLKPLAGDDNNNNYRVKPVTLKRDGTIVYLSDNTLENLAEHLPLFIAQGDYDAIGSAGQNKLRIGNLLMGIDFGHAYRQDNPIIGGLGHDFHVNNPKFKNFSIFYDAPRSHFMRGILKLAKLSGRDLKDNILEKYGEDFHQRIGKIELGTDKKPGADEQVFNDYIKKFTALREEDPQNADDYTAIIVAVEKAKGIAIASRDALVKRFESYLNVDPKVIDLMENLEKISAGKNGTSLRSPDNTVLLQHLHITSNQPETIKIEVGYDNVHTLSMNFNTKQEAVKAHTAIQKFLQEYSSDTNVSNTIKILPNGNMITFSFAQENIDALYEFFAENKIKKFYHPNDFELQQHYVKEQSLNRLINSFNQKNDATIELCPYTYNAKNELYQLIITPPKGQTENLAFLDALEQAGFSKRRDPQGNLIIKFHYRDIEKITAFLENNQPRYSEQIKMSALEIINLAGQLADIAKLSNQNSDFANNACQQYGEIMDLFKLFPETLSHRFYSNIGNIETTKYPLNEKDTALIKSCRETVNQFNQSSKNNKEFLKARTTVRNFCIEIMQQDGILISACHNVPVEGIKRIDPELGSNLALFRNIKAKLLPSQDELKDFCESPEKMIVFFRKRIRDKSFLARLQDLKLLTKQYADSIKALIRERKEIPQISDISDLIIRPMQNLTRSPLLFRELSKKIVELNAKAALLKPDSDLQITAENISYVEDIVSFFEEQNNALNNTMARDSINKLRMQFLDSLIEKIDTIMGDYRDNTSVKYLGLKTLLGAINKFKDELQTIEHTDIYFINAAENLKKFWDNTETEIRTNYKGLKNGLFSTNARTLLNEWIPNELKNVCAALQEQQEAAFNTLLQNTNKDWILKEVLTNFERYQGQLFSRTTNKADYMAQINQRRVELLPGEITDCAVEVTGRTVKNSLFGSGYQFTIQSLDNSSEEAQAFVTKIQSKYPDVELSNNQILTINNIPEHGLGAAIDTLKQIQKEVLVAKEEKAFNEQKNSVNGIITQLLKHNMHLTLIGEPDQKQFKLRIQSKDDNELHQMLYEILRNNNFHITATGQYPYITVKYPELPKLTEILGKLNSHTESDSYKQRAQKANEEISDQLTNIIYPTIATFNTVGQITLNLAIYSNNQRILTITAEKDTPLYQKLCSKLNENEFKAALTLVPLHSSFTVPDQKLAVLTEILLEVASSNISDDRQSDQSPLPQKSTQTSRREVLNVDMAFTPLQERKQQTTTPAIQLKELNEGVTEDNLTVVNPLAGNAKPLQKPKSLFRGTLTLTITADDARSTTTTPSTTCHTGNPSAFFSGKAPAATHTATSKHSMEVRSSHAITQSTAADDDDKKQHLDRCTLGLRRKIHTLRDLLESPPSKKEEIAQPAENSSYWSSAATSIWSLGSGVYNTTAAAGKYLRGQTVERSNVISKLSEFSPLDFTKSTLEEIKQLSSERQAHVKTLITDENKEQYNNELTLWKKIDAKIEELFEIQSQIEKEKTTDEGFHMM